MSVFNVGAELDAVVNSGVGRERFVAEPMADHASSGASYMPNGQITGWGQGIAQVAEALAR